jgi:hypothetical protein
VLAEFDKFPFEHFAWGQTLLYYNCVSIVTKYRILGKAWEESAPGGGKFSPHNVECKKGEA